MFLNIARPTLFRGRGPATPLALPAYWGLYGDSQTAGREVDGNYKNHAICFKTLWDASGYPAVTTYNSQGVSGRSLSGTLTYVDGRTFSGTPWIHLQESGDQNNTGQTTASAFGTTFYDGMVAINTKWPGCTISYETAYSFSDARKAQPYRNWDSYNTELRSQIIALRENAGITVHLVESEYYILQLVDSLGYDTVCYADTHPDAYHYQGIGNFCIALAMFKAFNYDVTTLTHSGISLDSGHKSTAISIVAGV